MRMLSNEVAALTHTNVGGKTPEVREKGRALARLQPSAVHLQTVAAADALHVSAQRRDDQHVRLGHLNILDELRPHVGCCKATADSVVDVGPSPPTSWNQI